VIAASAGTINVDGREYPVENIRTVDQAVPQLAAHMRARGFNAYGYVQCPSGEAVAYRSVKLGTWHIVQRVR
jgi:hypothetical protein